MSAVDQFFKDLENPELYERTDDVPIFGPHVRKKRMGDGSFEKVEVGDAELQEIADAIGEMEKDRGVLPVITPGHRTPGKKIPEEDQPKIWGYARNAKPGYYRTPSGKLVKTLLATRYLDRRMTDKEGKPVTEAAKEFPFRSVDYYPDTKTVTGVALLRQDPELDLGMMAYNGRPCVQYACDTCTEMSMDPTAAPSIEDAGETVGGGGDGSMGMDDGLPPEEMARADSYMRHYEKNHPAMKYMCDQYAASMAGAGGAGGAAPASLSPTNGSLPMGEKETGKGEMEAYVRQQVEQYQKAADKKVADMQVQYQKKIDELAKKLGESEREKRISQYQSKLETLAQHYDLDVAEEMKDCEHLTPEQFQRHVVRVEKSYKPNPTVTPYTGGAPWARGPQDGANGGTAPVSRDGLLSPENEAKVMQYFREHHKLAEEPDGWEKAVKAVMSSN